MYNKLNEFSCICKTEVSGRVGECLDCPFLRTFRNSNIFHTTHRYIITQHICTTSYVIRHIQIYHILHWSYIRRWVSGYGSRYRGSTMTLDLKFNKFCISFCSHLYGTFFIIMSIRYNIGNRSIETLLLKCLGCPRFKHVRDRPTSRLLLPRLPSQPAFWPLRPLRNLP